MIENISIEKLHPHPDNPRRDVGDVTELAESIKASGVLQNLTVVPATGYYYGDYYVVIGNRRLAAAKIAGLTELPCAVVEMDQKTQVATMLLENMQRSDLTVYEQAQGFQMMLDMGETVESVAVMTGLSQSTIRRRTKLLQFDADTFKATEGRNIDLQDYEKLFEIENAARRNKILEHIGTNNFNNLFQAALDAEKREKGRAALTEALNSVATEIAIDTDTSELKYITYINNVDMVKEIPDDGHEYFYMLFAGNYANIYRAYTDDEIRERNTDTEKRAAAEAAKREQQQRIEEINARMYTLRVNFLRDCSLKGKAKIIKEYASRTMAQICYDTPDMDIVSDILGAQIDNGIQPEEIWDILSPKFEVDPERVLLAMSYAFSGDHNKLDFCRNNELINDIYTLLGRFGYEMSDEEKALMDGTHELFAEAESEAEDNGQRASGD